MKSRLRSGRDGNFWCKSTASGNVATAVRSDIPVFVGSSKDPRAGVRWCAIKLKIRRYSARWRFVQSDSAHFAQPEYAAFSRFPREVFGILARHNISVDLITTSE